MCQATFWQMDLAWNWDCLNWLSGPQINSMWNPTKPFGIKQSMVEILKLYITLDEMRFLIKGVQRLDIWWCGLYKIHCRIAAYRKTMIVMLFCCHSSQEHIIICTLVKIILLLVVVVIIINKLQSFSNLPLLLVILKECDLCTLVFSFSEM